MSSAAETPTHQPDRRLRRSDVVLAVVLLASLSLALVELGSHWLANPWSRYSLVFIPLAAWVAYNEDYKPRHPRLGALIIVVAMLIQLVSAKAALLVVSRIALACALMGFLLNRGFASKRCALLSLFIVPIPYSLASDLGGKAVAEWMIEQCGALLGASVSVFKHVVSVDNTSLPVASTYAGLPLVMLCVGLAGYHSLRLQVGLTGALRALGILFLTIPVIQFTAISLAILALSSDSAPVAAIMLDTMTWLVPTFVVVVGTERAVPRRARGLPA